MDLLGTSDTLVHKLKDIDDHKSWDRFYNFYSPLILVFSKQKGCNEAMANDVLQESMAMLMTIMPEFQYDPRKGKFRSFLLKIVDRRIKDTFKREKWYCSLSTETKMDWIKGIEDPRVKNPDIEWDQLWEYNLFENALEQVKSKLSSPTFQSFQLYVLKQKPADEVAEKLGISKNTVFQHKNRVVKLLQQEVRRLKEIFGE